MSNVIKANTVSMDGALSINTERTFRNVKVKKLTNTAIIPEKGSKYSAGLDLRADISSAIIIAPHETVMIGTGLAIETPEYFFGAIAARSGIAYKRGLAPSNKLGVVDEDYRGEIKVALHNHSNEPQTVEPMEKIAQYILIPYLPFNFVEVDELTETERGDGGFGHSGRF